MADGKTSLWVEKLVTKNATLSNLMEEMRDSLVSDSPDDREAGLTLIVDVIKQLPPSFLSKEEVGTLLQFLLNRLESSALAGSSVISGINHLVLFSKELPEGVEKAVLKYVFMEGSVQSWPQRDRKLQYEIMQWLLKNRLPMVQAIGTVFIESFIKCIDGEKDPRCLLTVFDMFQKVCANFEIFGALAEEMFETVACYYPVEFKPQPTDTITRELLASSCARCLVASPSFAPYCYMLIDEKFNEEECVGAQREDVCALLKRACETFDHRTIGQHIEEVLGGIRMSALDPKNKAGSIPAEVLPALEAVMKTVQKFPENAKVNEHVVISNIIENLEPFVLQAEMGLSEKAFRLLRTVFEVAMELQAEQVLRQVVAWLTSLVQGESVNVAANKSDITKESLNVLNEWLQMTQRMKSRWNSIKRVFDLLSSSLIASLNVARETAPQEALILLYVTLRTFLLVGVSPDETLSTAENLIETGLKAMLLETESKEYLKLVRTFAEKYPQRMLEILDKSRDSMNPEKIVSVLSAASSDVKSFKTHEKALRSVLENYKQATPTDFQYFFERFSIIAGDNDLMMAVINFFDDLCVETPFSGDEGYERQLSTTLQRLTSQTPAEFDAEYTQRQAGRFLKRELNEDIRKRFVLSFLKCSDKQTLSDVYETLKSDKQAAPLVLFAAVNKGVIEVTELRTEDDLRSKFIKVKALLLAGHKLAPSLLEQLLNQLSIEASSSTSEIDELYRYLLDFEEPENNTDLCQYQTRSPLWRQRIYFVIVPIYKKVIDSVNEEQNTKLIGLLSPLLEFAKKLGSEASKHHFSSLLPILLASLAASEVPSTSVLHATPAFLELSDDLDASQSRMVVEKMCRVVSTAGMDSIVAGLESLRYVAERQPPKNLHPLTVLVETACNGLLKHKKRLVRRLAADVKNSWEMIITK